MELKKSRLPASGIFVGELLFLEFPLFDCCEPALDEFVLEALLVDAHDAKTKATEKKRKQKKTSLLKNLHFTYFSKKSHLASSSIFINFIKFLLKKIPNKKYCYAERKQHKYCFPKRK